MTQQHERTQAEYVEGELGEGEAVAVVYPNIYQNEAPQEAASALEAAVIILSVVAVFLWLVLR